MPDYSRPISALPGIGWPAIPNAVDAAVMALAQQFAASEWWPAEILRRAQFEQARTLVRFAAETVPFYRDRLANFAKLDVFALAEAWHEIPVLTRADIQGQTEAMSTTALPKGHGPTGQASSSGSTGLPVVVKSTRVTVMFYRAINLRYHRWHGREFHRTCGIIRALRGGREGAGKSWVHGFRTGANHTLDIVRPVAEQLDWLMERDIAYLLTYPTNLAALLRHSRETGRRPESLVEVSTMSELFDPALRDLCREVWGVPVHDMYSAQELGMMALECPAEPHYHVQAESILLEVLDDDGRPCKPGEVGRLVATDLHNFAQPLIRYALGDHAEAGASCSCGRGLPVLNRILGRTRNQVRLPGGGTFWPVVMFSHYAAAAPLKQMQLVQKSLSDVTLRMVARRALTADEEAEVAKLVRRDLGHPFNVTFEVVDAIERGANGKYEDFRSEVG